MHPDEAYMNFLSICSKYHFEKDIFNEAETRAKIIDFILRDCLGWNEKFIVRENPNDSGYSDYELQIDKIPVLVIEAKKSGEYFEIPVTMTSRSYKISGSISTTKNLMNAFNQVRNYCNEIGCKYAAVFNGYQLVLFSAITIGKTWKEGFCIVYRSLDEIKNNFNNFWNTLAFENVKNGSLMKAIEKGKRDISFKKVIYELHNPDQSWARNDLYVFLQPICDFIFSELIDEKRTEVLRECYVYDRSSKKPITEEMESYFSDKLPYFAQKYKISDIYEKELKAGSFEKEFWKKTYAKITGSLMVLLGGVGSGKSTFLHRFFKIILAEYENLIWFYIDLRGAPLKENEIEDFILKSIMTEWKLKYEPKLSKILRETAFSADENNHKQFFTLLFNLLRHLKFSIALIIDNVDQHTLAYQENIFLLAHHCTDVLKTVTIIALREETFVTSTRTGVFDAFHMPKFHISSPNFLSMIIKRIDFTIKLLLKSNLEQPFQSIPKETREDVIKYFSIIKSSLIRKNEQRDKIVKFIDSISVGNMREALRMFNNFIVSGNTNTKEIFLKHDQSGLYQLAYHQFIKSIILGEYRYYLQDRSNIINVFDFDSSLTDSHSNIMKILSYLLERCNKKSPIGRGYVLIDDLFSTAENISIHRDVIKDCLSRLSGFNLVEYDNQSKTDLENATYVKLTAAGRYYLNNLTHEFVYLDLVSIDTPISDFDLHNYLKKFVNTTDLEIRFDRTKRFLKYLVKFENEEFKNHPEYLHSDFSTKKFCEDIANQFEKEEKKIREKIEFFKQ
jgi:energy-coupling factor transporter ATP-binding protein EcfA2